MLVYSLLQPGTPSLGYELAFYSTSYEFIIATSITYIAKFGIEFINTTTITYIANCVI